jgi:transcriptional regulator with XRE-family HTH domain
MAGKTFSEQLRQAVLSCGKSRYRISKETGITEAQLSRFVNGHANLALSTIDKLTECIGARLAAEGTTQRGVRKGTKSKG